MSPSPPSAPASGAPGGSASRVPVGYRTREGGKARAARGGGAPGGCGGRKPRRQALTPPGAPAGDKRRRRPHAKACHGAGSAVPPGPGLAGEPRERRYAMRRHAREPPFNAPPVNRDDLGWRRVRRLAVAADQPCVELDRGGRHRRGCYRRLPGQRAAAASARRRGVSQPRGSPRVSLSCMITLPSPVVWTRHSRRIPGMRGLYT